MRTMRTFTFLQLLCACALTLGALAWDSGDAPRLRDHMPCSPGLGLLMIRSAQMSPYCEILCGSNRFLVASNDSNMIIFVSTKETSFHTPEGIRVGDFHSKVLALKGGEIHSEPGWGYYSTLPSGWHVLYGGIPGLDTLNGKPIVRDSVVHELFLR